jgi:hypothetical protein
VSDLPLIFQFEQGTAEGFKRLASLVLGFAIVIRTYIWATQVMMIRANEPPRLARFIFQVCRSILRVTGLVFRDPKKRKRYWALYMPFSLISVLIVAMFFATFGFIFIIYGVSNLDLRGSLFGSVSSISTLGFANQPRHTPTAVTFAIEGLTTTFFVGVLIVYVNAIFDDYNSRRQKMRKMDAVIDRAATGPQLLENAATTHGIAMLTPIFGDWAADFIELKKNHRSLEGYLSIYSLDTERHWAVDAPVILDAANLRNTLVDLPADPQAARCLDHGPKALDSVEQHFRDKMFGSRKGVQRREITRDAFDQTADRLQALKVPIVSDRGAAWTAFEAERGRYEPSITALRAMLDLDTIDWLVDDK